MSDEIITIHTHNTYIFLYIELKLLSLFIYYFPFVRMISFKFTLFLV